jgi:2-iminoacetate synthase
VEDQASLKLILDCASFVKEEIYGQRMVLFAPLYTGNHCSNNCLYCGFRTDNKDLKRVVLNKDQIIQETEALLKQGHKRVLLLCGEEIAPMKTEEFTQLKKEGIGTYTCFQETYDPELYKEYHPTGMKRDYLWRLTAMDRAMEGGIDDVGIGVLFGLAPYKAEVLAMLAHANHLEKTHGCGPHTISVPRIEPAPGAPLTEIVPFQVNDEDFKKIVAVLRVTLPYTGLILSTRESTKLRKELFHYGISQVSAGSKTDPGGYSSHSDENSQFTLGDHRNLEEVVSGLVDHGFVPSFCTGCYRMGRVGNDFMDLAKPGLIKKFCQPNGMSSFAEYLYDFAGEETRNKGLKLIEEMTAASDDPLVKERTECGVRAVAQGERDVYV